MNSVGPANAARFGTLALFLATGVANAYDVEVIQETGSAENRLDLVVLGDGYRVEDQAQLSSDTKKLLEGFWVQEFFASYRNYLNIRLVHVISNERGADNGSYGAMVDTALNTNFGCGGVDRLLCVDSDRAYEVAAIDAPDFDQLLVIVNDPKYGGSGGPIATSSIAPSAGDVVVHEIGHSLFGLADEYDTATPGFERCMGDCPEPNATTITDRVAIKWGHWVDPATELPTPDLGQDNSVVGAFEGCRYFKDDQYRPVSNCIMRSLGRSYCPVCSETAILAFYDKVSPIDALTPPGAVEMKLGDTSELKVEGPRPSPNTLSFVWTDENGAPLGENSDGTLALRGAALGVGAHTVTVAIADTTLLVRKDVDGVLKDEAAWQVTILPDGTGGAGGTGASGGTAGSGGVAGSGGAGGAGGSGASGGSSGAGGSGAEGGSGATSGSGGTGATGGAAGMGAQGGMGGASGGTGGTGTVEPPPSEKSGCGCRVGREGRSSSALLVLVCAFLAGRRRSRRCSTRSLVALKPPLRTRDPALELVAGTLGRPSGDRRMQSG